MSQGYVAGAVDYLFKPFDPSILRSKVAVFADLYKKNLIIKQQAQLIRQNEAIEQEAALSKIELENLQRYWTLAEAIPHLVWRGRIDGRIEYFNQNWHRYTGLTLEQSQGSRWQSAVHPEDLKGISLKWAQALKECCSFESECRIQGALDTGYRWHLVRIIPEKDPNGKVVGWLGTGTDIDDQKSLESKLREAREAALTASELKSEFLANMSHEIRTPLNTIIGMVDLLLETPLNDQQKSYVKVFEQSGTHLLAIISSILDISKIEAHALILEEDSFNLRELLNGLTSWAGLTAQMKNLEFFFSFDPELHPLIIGDANRLRQVLFNILSNAIKFTDKGSIKMDVRLMSRTEPTQMVEILVSDTGIGISHEQHQSIFREFSQADQSITRRYGGTGLGLAISKKIVTKMEGTLTVDSKLGEGSTFRMSPT